MTTTLYQAGLVEWPSLDDTDFRWILCDDTYDPAYTDQWIDDLVGELTHGSYARVTLTGSSIDPTATNFWGPCIRYTADDPTFTALGGATAVAWIVLARHVTNDADSPLLGCWSLPYTPSGADLTPLITDAGLHEQNLVTQAFWPFP